MRYKIITKRNKKATKVTKGYKNQRTSKNRTFAKSYSKNPFLRVLITFRISWKRSICTVSVPFPLPFPLKSY